MIMLDIRYLLFFLQMSAQKLFFPTTENVRYCI